MSFAVSTTGLAVHYRDTVAVEHLTVSIAPGAITGILGRNGAGKSTLLRVLAAHTRATSGRVLVDGEDPWEHPRLMIDTCLVPEDGGFESSTTVADVLQIADALRPRWDGPYADRLLERFEVPRKSKVGALSRGKRAALGAVVGLATRASLTMFDEPHLGMDAPSRYAFYDELLADYAAHPRTILLSTHLIDEAARLFEDVVILHRGRLLEHRPLADLQAIGAELTGPADAVDAIAAGLAPVAVRTLGRTRSAVVVTPVGDDLRARAEASGVDVTPLPLQDLFVHLTSEGAHQ